jgi:hypothetical protein
MCHPLLLLLLQCNSQRRHSAPTSRASKQTLPALCPAPFLPCSLALSLAFFPSFFLYVLSHNFTAISLAGISLAFQTKREGNDIFLESGPPKKRFLCSVCSVKVSLGEGESFSVQQQSISSECSPPPPPPAAEAPIASYSSFLAWYFAHRTREERKRKGRK